MLKYIPEDTSVTFAEIPDEICLCINISNCPHHCHGCHSKYLWEDIGEELTPEVIDRLIQKNNGVTCIVFMGGDCDKESLKCFAKHISNNYDNLLVGWYSGEHQLNVDNYKNQFDYIKYGPYIKELGPLNSKTTNQKLIKTNRNSTGYLEDITYKFQI